MPYKGGVQLLPESERRPTLSSYTSGNTYFYVALVIGVVALVASAVLVTYKQNLRERVTELHTKIKEQDNARNLKQEQELIAASKQSKIMGQLLEGKVYWSQALSKLEAMMQSSVKFTGMSAQSEKGTIEFQARADSFTTVAQQLASFANAAGIKDFTVGKLESKTSGEIEFSGELMIDTRTMLTKAVVTPTPTPTPALTPKP